MLKGLKLKIEMFEKRMEERMKEISIGDKYVTKEEVKGLLRKEDSNKTDERLFNEIKIINGRIDNIINDNSKNLLEMIKNSKGRDSSELKNIGNPNINIRFPENGNEIKKSDELVTLKGKLEMWINEVDEIRRKYVDQKLLENNIRILKEDLDKMYIPKIEREKFLTIRIWDEKVEDLKCLWSSKEKREFKERVNTIEVNMEELNKIKNEPRNHRSSELLL